MRTFRIILAAIGFAGIIYSLIELNYKDLSWQVNKSSYWTMILGVLIIFGMIYSIKYDAKRRKKS